MEREEHLARRQRWSKGPWTRSALPAGAPAGCPGGGRGSPSSGSAAGRDRSPRPARRGAPRPGASRRERCRAPRHGQDGRRLTATAASGMVARSPSCPERSGLVQGARARRPERRGGHRGRRGRWHAGRRAPVDDCRRCEELVASGWPARRSAGEQVVVDQEWVTDVLTTTAALLATTRNGRRGPQESGSRPPTNLPRAPLHAATTTRTTLPTAPARQLSRSTGNERTRLAPRAGGDQGPLPAAFEDVRRGGRSAWNAGPLARVVVVRAVPVTARRLRRRAPAPPAARPTTAAARPGRPPRRGDRRRGAPGACACTRAPPRGRE